MSQFCADSGRTRGFYMKCTDEEREMLRETAKRRGLSMTDAVLIAMRMLSGAEPDLSSVEQRHAGIVPCPKCGADTRVVKTVGARRLRKCGSCSGTTDTIEIPAEDLGTVRRMFESMEGADR